MTVEIGELRARFTAEASQMRQGIRSVKQDLKGLGEEGQRTAGQLKKLDNLKETFENVNTRIKLQQKLIADLKNEGEGMMNKAVAEMKKLEAQSDITEQKIRELQNQLAKLQQEQPLSSFHADLIKDEISEIEKALQGLVSEADVTGSKMAELQHKIDHSIPDTTQTKVLKAEAALAKLKGTADKTEKEIIDLEGSLRDAGKEMDGFSDKSKSAEHSIKGIAAGFAAFGAGAALNKLVNMVKTLSNETNELANSYRGLSVVAKSFNVDSDQAVDLADKLADRWGIGKDALADTVKTYVSMNLTLEETERIITSTADAAAYNREAHLSWGDAIKNVAQGIKAGNSNLTDSAGITTNLSVMQERYAKSIGTTAGKLTEAQKVQAAYNGMIEEGAIFAGNADDAMTGFTGTQASFQSTIQEARAELGEAFIPALERILELLTPMIKGFAEWTAGNKETVMGLTAAGIAVTAFIALLGTLTATFLALNAAMGPVGWAILTIGSLVAGVSAYTAATNQASEAVRDFITNQEQLNKVLNDSSESLNANQYTMLQENIALLEQLLARKAELEQELSGTPDFVLSMLDVSERMQGTTSELTLLYRELKNINSELKNMDYGSVEEAEVALRGMKKASDESLGALVQLTRQQMQENIVLVDGVSQMKEMSREYDELSAQANLTEQQKERLADVVKKLKEEYPGLQILLDEENQWHIENKEALDEYITGEENRLNAAIATAKQVIEAAKIEAQERVRLARESMAEIERIEAKGLVPSKEVLPFLSDTSAGILDKSKEFTLNHNKKKFVDEISKGNYEINEANKLLDDLTIGYDPFRRKVIDDPNPNKKGKKEKKQKQKTPAELAAEEYQRSLAYIQYKKDLNQLSEKEELAMLERLENRYKQYSDIRKDAEVRIYKLKDDMYKREYSDEKKLMKYKQDLGQLSEKEELARLVKMLSKYKDNTELRMELEVQIYKLKEQMQQKDFQHSNEWITQEERRMRLAGESEEKISEMKLATWTRVRNRYSKDSDFYKQADTQVYNIKLAQMKDLAKKEEEAAKEKEKQRKDDLKRALDAINKAKKAELDALNERRKAIQKFYEEQNETIDDSERLKERNELLAEIEKYRFATSEKGQKHFQELQEKLRKMDIDEQKRDLQKERDQKLEALDEEKADIETWYDELRSATDELTGDLTKLYKLADDERLKSFIETNGKIKEEMEKLKEFMTIASGNEANVIAQMMANSAAWSSASPNERVRLSEENDRLGSSIGAVKNDAQGRWYKPDGTPLYHSGGIAGEMNFRSANDLMPDEITAILKRGEPVLTPQQVSSLVGADSGSKVHIENLVGVQMNDVVLEDEIDLRAYERSGGNEAAEILRKQLTGGG